MGVSAGIYMDMQVIQGGIIMKKVRFLPYLSGIIVTCVLFCGIVVFLDCVGARFPHLDKKTNETTTHKIDTDEIAKLYFKGGHIGDESEIGCVKVYVGYSRNLEPLDVCICEKCGWIGDTKSASLHNASHKNGN